VSKRRTQRIPESQRHTERMIVRLPPGCTIALVDDLRGDETRSAYVARLVLADMRRRK